MEKKSYQGCVRLTERQFQMAQDLARAKGNQRGEIMTISELFRTLLVEEWEERFANIKRRMK